MDGQDGALCTLDLVQHGLQQVTDEEDDFPISSFVRDGVNASLDAFNHDCDDSEMSDVYKFRLKLPENGAVGINEIKRELKEDDALWKEIIVVSTDKT